MCLVDGVSGNQTLLLSTYRSTLRLLSHATRVAFSGSHVQSLHGWREVHLSGLNRTFPTAFSSQAARFL